MMRFTVELRPDVAEQLHEAARRRGLRDRELAAEAVERGLATLPELVVAWMKGSRARLSPAAATALGRPAALTIQVLGGDILELRPAGAAGGVAVQYDRRGRATFSAQPLRTLGPAQTVWLREEDGVLVGRFGPRT